MKSTRFFLGAHLMALLMPATVFANGGLILHSSVSGPSRVQLVDDAGLVLEEEVLTIKLENEDVLVTCVYTMRKQTSAAKAFQLAFHVPFPAPPFGFQDRNDDSVPDAEDSSRLLHYTIRQNQQLLQDETKLV